MVATRLRFSLPLSSPSVHRCSVLRSCASKRRTRQSRTSRETSSAYQKCAHDTYQMRRRRMNMRNVFLFMMVTLDGFFEGPDHSIDWHNVDKEFNDFAIDQLNEV